MDPVACLNEVRTLLRQSGNRETAAEKLNEYFEWRLNGGFEPKFTTGVNAGTSGDEMAKDCLIKIGRVADTLSNSLSFYKG